MQSNSDLLALQERGVASHREKLNNLNVIIPEDDQVKLLEFIAEKKFFEAHMLLHKHYIERYPVTLRQALPDKKIYSSNKLSHERFLRQYFHKKASERNMGSFGASSLLLKDIIENTSESRSDNRKDLSTPADADDFMRCAYYIELVFGYDKHLRKSVLDYAFSRLSSSPEWKCILTIWNKLTNLVCFSEDANDEAGALLCIIRESHRLNKRAKYDEKRVIPEKDVKIYAKLIKMIMLFPEKFGFDKEENIIFNIFHRAIMSPISKKAILMEILLSRSFYPSAPLLPKEILNMIISFTMKAKSQDKSKRVRLY